MPPDMIDVTPCEAAPTLVTVSAWPGSGSVSFDSTVIVVVPPSSNTVTLSGVACGGQSTTIETVASLLSAAPSFARYLKEAGPHTPAPGMKRNATLGASGPVPPTSDPADSTAVSPSRPHSVQRTRDAR